MEESPEKQVAEQREIAEQLKKLASYLDASGIDEYVRLTRRPGKLLFLNFTSGVARGLGFTIGTTIVLAILYKIVSELVSWNIPYLGEPLRDFMDAVQNPPPGAAP